MADKKNAAEVLIDGRIYTLSGAEPAYLQKVSGYLNSKIAEMKLARMYRGLDPEYRQLFLNLNIADDYFRSEDEKAELERKNAELEKELYSMKHEIVSTKLKLENSLRQQELTEARAEEWKEKYLASAAKNGDTV